MLRSAKIIWVVYSISFVCFMDFAVRPTPILGLLLLPVSLAYFVACAVSLVKSFTWWKVHRFKAFAPFMIGLAVWMVSRLRAS